MQTPTDLISWLSEQISPLFVVFAFLAAVLAILWVSAHLRRVRLNQARLGTNEDTFIGSLIVYGFDPEISRAVYRYLQERQNVRFPIEATDMLDEDLGLDLVDLEQTQREIFPLVRRVYQPGLRHMPLVTVEDLVRLVQASPRLQDRAA